MYKMKILIIIILSLFLVGCVNWVELTPEMKNFQYTYKVEGKKKKKIWKLARNHFAIIYGDYRRVLSVQDEEEGTMIGKGNVKWCFDPPICAVNEWCDYLIRFDAEDGNAKLKLNLVGCRLTEGGYESIKNDLDGLGRGLRNALLE